MSEKQFEQAANDVNVVVLELVEVDVLAAIECHLEFLDCIAEARHSVQALGLDSALSPLYLLHTLLHKYWPYRIRRFHECRQVNAEYTLDETHLRLAVGWRALGAFLVCLKTAILTLDAL